MDSTLPSPAYATRTRSEGVSTRNRSSELGRKRPRGARLERAEAARKLEAERARVRGHSKGWCDPLDPKNREWCRDELGMDVDQVRGDAEVELRAVPLEWSVGLFTRSGKPRQVRLASCGRIRLGLRAGKVGLGMQRCRDRLCPACMRIRARTLGVMMRRFLEARQADAKRRFFMVTLTDRKMVGASVQTAIDEHMTKWRRFANEKYSTGREWRRYVAGGVRCLEVTYQKAGTIIEQGDGSRHVVKQAGAHPHFHVLVELAPPPTGISHADWEKDARRAMWRSWSRTCPTASLKGFDFRAVDEARIGEICKYPFKPLLEAVRMKQKELALAMASRKVCAGFGAWRRWKPEAESLLAEEGEKWDPIYLGESMTSFRMAVESGRELVRWTMWATEIERARGYKRVGKHIVDVGPDGTACLMLPVSEVFDAVRRRPKTFQRIAMDTAQAVDAQKRGGELVDLARREEGEMRRRLEAVEVSQWVGELSARVT